MRENNFSPILIFYIIDAYDYRQYPIFPDMGLNNTIITKKYLHILQMSIEPHGRN
jgi:hypothetical protein